MKFFIDYLWDNTCSKYRYYSKPQEIDLNTLKHQFYMADQTAIDIVITKVTKNSIYFTIQE